MYSSIWKLHDYFVVTGQMRHGRGQAINVWINNKNTDWCNKHRLENKDISVNDSFYNHHGNVDPWSWRGAVHPGVYLGALSVPLRRSLTRWGCCLTGGATYDHPRRRNNSDSVVFPAGVGGWSDGGHPDLRHDLHPSHGPRHYQRDHVCGWRRALRCLSCVWTTESSCD